MASIWTSHQQLGIFSADLSKITRALGSANFLERTHVGRYTILDLETDPPFPFSGKYKQMYYCISSPLGNGEFNVHVAARSQAGLKEFDREKRVLTILRGARGVLQPLHIAQTKGFDYLISKLFNQGDLFTYIKGLPQSAGSFELDWIGYQVVCALAECHARSVILRDLKLENVVIRQLADQSIEVKLIDFGLSFIMNEDSAEESIRPCHSPRYVDPEETAYMNKSGCSLPVSFERDRWPLGSILYALKTKALPAQKAEGDRRLGNTVFPPPLQVPLGIFEFAIRDLLYNKSESRLDIAKIKAQMRPLLINRYPHVKQIQSLRREEFAINPFPLSFDQHTPLLARAGDAEEAGVKKRSFWSSLCCCIAYKHKPEDILL